MNSNQDIDIEHQLATFRRGAHELRLKDKSGGYRVVYALVRSGTVHVLHAFKKTTQATPKRNIEMALLPLFLGIGAFMEN